MTTTMIPRESIIQALRTYINQRSGLDRAAYGRNKKALQQAYTQILRDGRDARAMLQALEESSLSAEDIGREINRGRLRLSGYNPVRVEFNPLKDFATEYRAAMCARLAHMLGWHYGYAREANDGLTLQERAYDWAVRTLGRGIAGRWFA